MSTEKMTHTPEPWRIQSDRHEQDNVYGGDDNWVAICPHQFVTSLVPTMHANANRIVACVNAMSGIQNPGEFVGKVRELHQACCAYVNADGPDRTWQGRRLKHERIGRLTEALASMLPAAETKEKA